MCILVKIIETNLMVTRNREMLGDKNFSLNVWVADLFAEILIGTHWSEIVYLRNYYTVFFLFGA